VLYKQERVLETRSESDRSSPKIEEIIRKNSEKNNSFMGKGRRIEEGHNRKTSQKRGSGRGALD
jgi:hypothetical protein